MNRQSVERAARKEIERVFNEKKQLLGVEATLDLTFSDLMPIPGEAIYAEAFPPEKRVWMEVFAPDATTANIIETVCEELIHIQHPEILNHEGDFWDRVRACVSGEKFKSEESRGKDMSTEANMEYLIKCMRKDVKEDLLNAVGGSNMPDEKKDEIIQQLEAIKPCRGTPIKLEGVESISSLSDVLNGTISILVEDGCPTCSSLKEKISSGKVGFVDINSAEGEKVVEALGTNEVPTAYTYKEGRPVKCEMFNDEEAVLVKCDEETISLTE